MSKIGRNDPCHCGSDKKYKKCCLDNDIAKEKGKYQMPKKHIKFDPKSFISEPYIKCPKCSENEFGVALINGSGYSRRCKNCMHDSYYKLPPIEKKLIYLDQPVISNITKVLDPESNGHERASRDPYWLELFKKIDTLLKLQLIICPDSIFHREESQVSPDYESMRRLYEHFSGGATFYDHDTIARFQIIEHFTCWLNGTPEKVRQFEPAHVIHGDLHKWDGKINISVDMGESEGATEELRESRERLFLEMERIFSKWKEEKSRTFDEWVQEEARAYGKANWENFVSHLKGIAEVQAGIRPFGINELFPPSSQSLISQMLSILKLRGNDFESQLKKQSEYFNSPEILQVPYIRLSSLLFASIARMATLGQIRPPSRGVFVDINAIASILPYVNAIFIDDENAKYLSENPVKDKIEFSTKIFSNRNRSEFIKYLDKILNEASEEHLKTVKEVYGDNVTPFTSILIDDRKRREKEPPRKKRPSLETIIKEELNK